MNLKQRGFLIAIEGIDGAGKTTVAQAIKRDIEKCSLPVLLTKEPGGTSLGEKLRAILAERSSPLDTLAEFLLFSADRAQHLQQIIMPALQAGMVVISDRMADSSRAYQGFGRGLDLETINTITALIMKNIVPDITLYIALEPKVAWERVQERGEPLTSFEQERREFFSRVTRGFDTIFAHRNDVVKLDGSLPAQEINAQALDAVMNALQKKDAIYV